jgi:hypothetical protein
MKRSLRIRIGLILALAASAACGGSSSSAPIPARSPGPGILTGTYEVRGASDGVVRPAVGATIGLFRKAVSFAGPVTADQPRPIAQVVTGPDGGFRFDGLAPGRYFVEPMDLGAPRGVWVELTSSSGASVTLIGCSGCPVPL